MDNILEKAYRLLYPGKEPLYRFNTVYSGRFNDYGANIELKNNVITLKLSRRFHTVSEEIQIGIAQELLCRLLGKRAKTMEMDIYNSFIKNVHISIPKLRSHPQLEESFDRVNQRYFLGFVERPNLVWGKPSKRTLGTYDFKTDTIRISRIFTRSDPTLLDYVMFHEMLHKQNKFRVTGSRTSYHDGKFRRAEKIFKDSEKVEKDLNRFVAKVRLKSFLGLERY